jgi:hypothetical protein
MKQAPRFQRRGFSLPRYTLYNVLTTTKKKRYEVASACRQTGLTRLAEASGVAQARRSLPAICRSVGIKIRSVLYCGIILSQKPMAWLWQAGGLAYYE